MTQNLQVYCLFCSRFVETPAQDLEIELLGCFNRWPSIHKAAKLNFFEDLCIKKYLTECYDATIY